ncbi:MAG: heavy metal-associated domain-containing protein [Bacteroidota bacterium]
MKSIIKISLTILSLFAVMAAFAQKPKTETFKVSGNCGMCKKIIESAVAKQAGVTKATWNKETKMMTVVYQPSKTTVDAIQKKIAAVGYDTPKFRGDDKAYDELPGCCQYDRESAEAKND